MKSIITIFAFTILFLGQTNAQMIKSPLKDKVTNEKAPTSIEEGSTWVKGHWEWVGYDYNWVDGAVVPAQKNHYWVDGEWERNNTTGAWFYSDGYWEPATNRTTFVGSKKEEDNQKSPLSNMFGK